MSTAAPPIQITREEVERASERDAKHYELISGQLKEKVVGTKSLFIASQICDRLNAIFYPKVGFAVVEAMVYCFDRPNHGRKPDVSFVKFDRLADKKVPVGDILLSPEVVVEVLSPGNTGIELEDKLDEYLGAGVPMVWIVNPDRQTIRIYRNDGTTRVFRGKEIIENQPGLPGFRLVTADIFPLP